jgi:hypothetical protein
MLLYNTNGTVSEIIVTSIIDGKATYDGQEIYPEEDVQDYY